MTRPAKLGIAAAVAVLVFIGSAACGSDPAPADTSGTPAKSPAPSPAAEATEQPAEDDGEATQESDPEAAAPVVLRIKDFAYEGPGKVAPGTEITVMNDDTAAHTVTAEGKGGFDVVLPPGKSATFKAPSEAGSYKYICIYHANMRGTLTVG